MSKDLPGDPDIERLATADEIVSAWKALTTADRKRLAAYAETLAKMHQFADPGITRGDLLQEADARVLGETRQWKLRKITFMEFMFGVLRSIAGDLKRTKAGKVKAASQAEDFALLDDLPSRDLIDRNDPETVLIAREEEERAKGLVATLQLEFQTDDDAFFVLECMIEGLPPREIRAQLNMSETDFDAVRNRIARRVRKLLRPN